MCETSNYKFIAIISVFEVNRAIMKFIYQKYVQEPETGAYQNTGCG